MTHEVSNRGNNPESEPGRVALEWFASEDAWLVTAKSIEDGRFGFTAPAYSIYATPWGFARAALREFLPDEDGFGV